MRRLAENLKVIGLKVSADHNAGVDTDSVNVGLGHDFLLLFVFGGLTGDAVLTVNSGATAGTKTTAETFNYRLGSAAIESASADVYGSWSTSAGLTLTAATYQNKVLEVEISGAELTDGQPWVTAALSSAASALNAGIVGILRARAHDGDGNPTAI